MRYPAEQSCDPRREVTEPRFEPAARTYGLSVVALTHVYLGFTPGHTEMVDATVAAIAIGGASPVSFPICCLHDGGQGASSVEVAGVAIEVLSAPGRTVVGSPSRRSKNDRNRRRPYPHRSK